MPGMAIRTRSDHEATRLARWILSDVGRELRLARISAGIRQVDVARSLGTSAARISRVENGRLARLHLTVLSRHAAAVGLKPSLRLYPAGRRLLDRPQIELLARLRTRLHPDWTWETEVPMPRAEDLRSGDCRIAIPGCAILVEAYTRLADWQAQTAAAARKKRDLGADRLILLLAATHANRAAAAEAGPVAVDGTFPLRTKATLAALGEGRDPGGDAIVFL
jgi:transcriptional regulator with XRE-family HTH domain